MRRRRCSRRRAPVVQVFFKRLNGQILLPLMLVAAADAVMNVVNQAECRVHAFATFTVRHFLHVEREQNGPNGERLLFVAGHVQRTGVMPEGERALRPQFDGAAHISEPFHIDLARNVPNLG